MPKSGTKTDRENADFGTVSVHLRLRIADADLLKQIANERDQSPSRVVRWLLRSLQSAKRKNE